MLSRARVPWQVMMKTRATYARGPNTAASSRVRLLNKTGRGEALCYGVSHIPQTCADDQFVIPILLMAKPNSELLVMVCDDPCFQNNLGFQKKILFSKKQYKLSMFRGVLQDYLTCAGPLQTLKKKTSWTEIHFIHLLLNYH